MSLEAAYLGLWFAGRQHEQLLLRLHIVTAAISAFKRVRRCSNSLLTSLRKHLLSHYWQFWCIWKTDSFKPFRPIWPPFPPSCLLRWCGSKLGENARSDVVYLFGRAINVERVLMSSSVFTVLLSTVWIFAFGSFTVANYKPTKACKQKSQDVTCGWLIGQLLGNLSSCQVRGLKHAAGGRGGWLCQ